MKNPQKKTLLKPKDKSKYFFIRAKNLYFQGSQYSVVVERVLKDMNRAISLHPGNVKHYLFLAKVYFACYDLSSCIYCYRIALRIEPSNYGAREKLANCLAIKGQEYICEAFKFRDDKTGFAKSLYVKAKFCFDEAMRFHLEDNKLRVFKIICMVKLEELQGALEGINLLLGPKKNPKHEIYILRAKILWAMGLIEEGNKDIRFAAALIPTHPEVLAYSERVFRKSEKLYDMSVEAFAEGKYADAKRLVVYALSLSKEDLKLHMMLSKIHRVMGDLQGAYATIQKAMLMYQNANSLGFDVPDEIVKQTNLIFNDLALEYAAAGELDKSVALLSKAISSERALSRGLTDIDHRFLLNRGDCYRLQHKMVHALADYNAALALRPLDGDIRTRISMSHYLNGTDFFNDSMYKEACVEYDAAVKFNPHVPEYYAARGKARYYCVDYPGAYADYKMSLQLNPNNPEIQQRIQQFESAGSNIATSNGLQTMAKDEEVLSPHKVKVTTDDMVEMMLNPYLTRGLPRIPLHKRAPAAAKHAHLSEANTGKVLFPRLPVDEMLAAPLAAVVEQEKKLQTVLAQKLDNQKGALWSMMEHAGHMAKNLADPTLRPDAGGGGGGGFGAGAASKSGKNNPAKKSAKMPQSLAALKRESQEKSKEARLHPLIGGIVTRSDDPDLKSLEPIIPNGRKHGTMSTKGGAVMPNAAEYENDRRRAREKEENDRVLLRKSSVVYSVPEGPRLSVSKVGDTIVLHSSHSKQSVVVDDPVTRKLSRAEQEKLRRESGENMMLKWRENLLNRSFDSEGIDNRDIVDARTPHATPGSVSPITVASGGDGPEPGGRYVEPPARRSSLASIGNEPSKRRPSNALLEGTSFFDDFKVEPVDAANGTAWKDPFARSDSKHSLLLLDEDDEIRYLNQYREQEERKEQAREQVVRAMKFAISPLKQDSAFPSRVSPSSTKIISLPPPAVDLYGLPLGSEN